MLHENSGYSNVKYLFRGNTLHHSTCNESANNCEKKIEQNGEEDEVLKGDGDESHLRCSLVMSAPEPTDAMLREG